MLALIIDNDYSKMENYDIESNTYNHTEYLEFPNNKEISFVVFGIVISVMLEVYLLWY